MYIYICVYIYAPQQKANDGNHNHYQPMNTCRKTTGEQGHTIENDFAFTINNLEGIKTT
jgi:hypothetical protein